MSNLLDGLTILLLEDEFLIAMDVEQICRDHGAHDVVIARTVDEAHAVATGSHFDAAIVDMMLAGSSTLEFADVLKSRGVPFIFASGYADAPALARNFPSVPVVAKPYGGSDLMDALASACRRTADPV
jgi:CheY-like chemotaxis protein